MAGPPAVSLVSTLSTALAALTPQQLGSLGHHLTQSQEMQALQLLSTMQGNPAIAPALMGSLTNIPNMPPQVLTWVSLAVAQPAAFAQNMVEAVAALQNAAVAPGLLGNLGL